MTFYPPVPSCQIKQLSSIYEKYFGHKTNGYFVEVGAFDGKNWSNTYGLGTLGWHGIQVEPNRVYADKCRENHATNPNITVHQVACSDRFGSTKLYLGGSISTIKPETVDIYSSLPEFSFVGMDHTNFIIVNMAPLWSLLESANWPAFYDLLVIDVEGAEMDVLSGAGIAQFRPSMLIVETHEDFPDARLSCKGKMVGEFLASYGYIKIHHDIINSIYVDKELHERR